MDKLFICLANSYKRGGRCVAGIEIRFNAAGHWGIVHDVHGTPCWIRPISKSTYGEIPNEEAIFIELLDIVRAVGVEPCPHGAHAENVYYERLETTHLQVKLSGVIIEHLLDHYHKDIFYNQGKAIHPSVYSQGNYSLMFICPENAWVYVDTYRERPQFRMAFQHIGVNYDFPITDPDFLDFLRDDPEQIGDFPNIMISVSLGLEHEGWHHKLVAGVIGYHRRELPTITIDDEENSDMVQEPEELSYMEQQKQLHANAYAKWTPEDDALLMELYTNGLSVKELMEQFGRNRGAIRSRLKKLAEERILESMNSSPDHPPYEEYTDNLDSSLLKEDELNYETRSEKKLLNWRSFLVFWKKDKT